MEMFGTETQRYLEAITARTKPRRVVVCMLYYLDEDVHAERHLPAAPQHTSLPHPVLGCLQLGEHGVVTAGV
jgi:hypothetical protein